MEHQKRHAEPVMPEVQGTAAPRDNLGGDESSIALLRGNVTEAIRIVLLRRWSFFIPFCLATGLATIVSHWIPRSYESVTLIERRDHPVLINLRQTAATGGFARIFRPTLTQDLTCPEAMTEAVEEAGIISDLPREPDGGLTEDGAALCRDKAASLTGGVDVRLTQKSEHFDQIRISYRGSDPIVPQRLVEAVKNTYIRRTRSKLTELLTEGMSYFEKVAASQRDQIAALEEELLGFQADYIGIDPTNPGALKLKLTSLETEQSELGREITTLEREINSRRQLLEAYTAAAGQTDTDAQQTFVSPPHPDVLAAQEAIHTLEQEIRQLQFERGMTERHPEIVDRRSRIARLQEQVAELKTAAPTTTPAVPPVQAPPADLFEWDIKLSAIQMELLDRQGRLDSARSRLRIVEADIEKHQALEANIFRYRKEYKLKSDTLEQTRADYRENTRRASEIASILNADESERGITFTELKPPSPSIRPVKPKGATVVVLSLAAGLIMGAVCVLLRELFDQTYHTTRQISRSLGLAILESVDEIVTSVDRARLFRKRVIYTPVLVALLLGGVGLSCAAAFLSLEKPQTYERLINVPEKLWHQLPLASTTTPGR